ncbi:MAG: hypothetical protein IT539_13815 [Bradyrhizobiaceae bacterium]|nr:hypothetical protein [Bradyrhizobiaceae bacterium]
MATAQQIKRLKADVDELASKLRAGRQRVCSIQMPEWLDKDAVLDRHKKLYPAEADAELIVFLTIYEGDEEMKWGMKKYEEAARQIDEEERARLSPAELTRTRAERVARAIARRAAERRAAERRAAV